MKYKFALLILTFFLGTSVHAGQYGFFGGLNSTEFDSDASWDRELGFEGGVTAHFDIQDKFLLRTGAGFVQKKSSTQVLGSSIDLEFSYLEVPVTVLYDINDSVGLIGGLNFDIKLSDSCGSSVLTSCSVLDAESLVFNLVLGAHIKLSEESRIEPLIEILGLSDVASGTKIGNSLSLRYIYML